MYDIQESVKVQKKYCEDNKAPHFAPSNGVCYNCRKQIYSPIEKEQGDRKYTTGITVEEAGKALVTGCPHCNRSYCD